MTQSDVPADERWHLLWWCPVLETRWACGNFIFDWSRQYRIASWLAGGR